MPDPIGSDFFFRSASVSEPDLSPDGDRVAYTFSWVAEGAPEAHSRVDVIDLPGGKPRTFTRGSNANQPRWSPDGQRLAFLRKDADGRPQLWIMPAELGEGRQLTRLPGKVSSFAWSPDGSRIALVAEDRPGGYDLKDRAFSADRVRYRDDGVGLRWYRRHIYIADSHTGEAASLTGGSWDDSAPAWSPDGSQIAFVSSRDEERDTTARNELYVAPADGGEPEVRSGGLFMVGGFGWAPDGRRLVAVGAESGDEVGGYSLICQGWLYVLEPGEPPRRITDDSVRPVADAPPKWTADGRAVFLADARGQSYLCSVPASGGPIARITPGGCQISSWSAGSAGNAAAFVANFPDSPADLYTSDLSSGSQTRHTSVNSQYLEQHPPAGLEKFTITRSGFDVEARFWLPPSFDPSGKYPMLLEIHGGPHSTFYDAFHPIHQIAATSGYVVLAVNPRGSSTYGLDFARAVHGDWGGEDYQELMAAVDDLASRPYVDEQRMVVHGSSYGGFMASWVAAHTDRFRAAVAGAPVTFLPSFYGTSDIGVQFSEVQLGGDRFERLGHYVERSPLTHAATMNTPLLLMHGEEDNRVLIEQSEQLFVALKRAGKHAEFVRLPGASHGFMRSGPPHLRKEYVDRALEWFDRWLDGSEASR